MTKESNEFMAEFFEIEVEEYVFISSIENGTFVFDKLSGETESLVDMDEQSYKFYHEKLRKAAVEEEKRRRFIAICDHLRALKRRELEEEERRKQKMLEDGWIEVFKGMYIGPSTSRPLSSLSPEELDELMSSLPDESDITDGQLNDEIGLGE